MVDSRWDRLSAASGLIFAVLFVVGVLLPGLPSGGQSDATINEFYADSGNRLSVIAGGYALILAGAAFLVFAAGLHRGLRGADGESGILPTVALGAGVVFVAMLYGASCAWTNVAAGMEFGGEPQPGAEIPVWFNQFGFGLLLAFGSFAASLLIAATSLVALRTAVLPRWLVLTGFVCAALLLLSVVFLPLIALPVWAVATSIAMLKRPAGSTERAARATAAAA